MLCSVLPVPKEAEARHHLTGLLVFRIAFASASTRRSSTSNSTSSPAVGDVAVLIFSSDIGSWLGGTRVFGVVSRSAEAVLLPFARWAAAEVCGAVLSRWSRSVWRR